MPHDHSHDHGSSHDHSSHDHSSHDHGKDCCHDDHGHGHGHGHHDDHHGASDRMKAQRALKMASVLCFTFMIVEVIGGWMAGSLAVLSDAAHLCVDLSSFIIAIMANYLSMKPATDKMSFGMVRAEVLSALFSVSVLLVLTAYLVVEACFRINDWRKGELEPVDGKLMTIVAGIGIVINIALAFILGPENHVHLMDDGHSHSHGHAHGHDDHDDHDVETGHHDDHDDHDDHDHDHDHDHGHGHGRKKKHRGKKSKTALLVSSSSSKTSDESEGIHIPLIDKNAYGTVPSLAAPAPASKPKNFNINQHAALLHVIGDLIQSVAVFIAGCLIWWKPSWSLADPICTILFSFIVIYTTVGVVSSTVNVLLEGVPKGIDFNSIRSKISQVRGVTNVHDLHIWSVTVGKTALSMHCSATDPRQALLDISEICKKEDIHHTTVQVQFPTDRNCLTCNKEGHTSCL